MLERISLLEQLEQLERLEDSMPSELIVPAHPSLVFDS